ncbi:hypothetical protein ACPPVT_21525 [Angustibacter sp. McL0619]|uniref:hypothetical protein n=1 Tax=Angustibacter sp. McL0619 TaxID=3415676 RepID=UPI003CFB09EF
MSKVVVERLTVDEAWRRRIAIIAAVGGDESGFRNRALAFVLDARELALYDELMELDYLLAS